MRVAYSVSNVPPAGAGAFTPGMTRNGIFATGGLMKRLGSPGVVLVEAEKPGLPVTSFDERTSPSYVAPDAIAPDIYVALADNMGPFAAQSALHASWRDMPLPVPTTSVTPLSTVRFRRPRIGGRKVWNMPQVIARWTNASKTPASTSSG